MLDIPSQYMHHCVVLFFEVYCYFVRVSAIWLLIRARDNCCVLCDVTRDMLSLVYGAPADC